jgi:hypothetical protein
LENPQCRAIAKARKFRMRLGGGPSVLDPLPGKPPRMHWRTYDRMYAAAMAADERLVALDIEWLRARHGVALGPL